MSSIRRRPAQTWLLLTAPLTALLAVTHPVSIPISLSAGSIQVHPVDAGPVSCESRSGEASGAKACISDALAGLRAPLSPGEPVSTTLEFASREGPRNAVLRVRAATPCRQTDAADRPDHPTDFCDRVGLTITSGGRTVFAGTLAGFGRAPSAEPIRLDHGQVVRCRFVLTLDGSVGNEYQGLSATSPLSWTVTETP